MSAEDDDYPDGSQEKISSAVLLSDIPQTEPGLITTLSPIPSQDLNLCCNELPTVRSDRNLQEKEKCVFILVLRFPRLQFSVKLWLSGMNCVEY
jgi:hypothetical protein